MTHDVTLVSGVQNSDSTSLYGRYAHHKCSYHPSPYSAIKILTTSPMLGSFWLDGRQCEFSIGGLYLTDIYKILYPTTAKYAFFSTGHGTFSRIEYTLGHKVIFYTFKKIKIIQSMFSNHNRIKLKINKRNLEIHKSVETKQHNPK